MALAKWMGFGPPTPPTVAPRGGGPSADVSKPGAITRGCRADRKQFGLENFGNTCYVNSVLQALYFCYPFRELVVSIIDRSNLPSAPESFAPSSPPPYSPGSNPRAKTARKNSTAEVPRTSDTLASASASPANGATIPITPPSMFSALRSLFLHIANNTLDKGTVAPRAFVDKLKKENELFRSTMHQDAHEFLIFLLNKVAEDLEEEGRIARSGHSSGEDISTSIVSAGPSSHGSVSTTSTFVQDLFEGVLTSETRCLTCETVSARDEAFLDLSLDIEQNSSVTACLKQFSASEMLCQKNKFFCDSCCGLQEAEKRMKIKRLPNVLALHLKRFKYQEDVGRYIKLAYRVAFPLELRLFNTVDDAQDPDRLFELFAIVVHIGNGPHHGHYVAVVKSNGSWLLFDDDTVETIREADISKYFGDSNNGSAYVLYYQAVDMDMQALGLKDDAPARDSIAETSSLQAPALPPGLTHEGDSDASEGLAPGTPASPALTRPIIVTSSPTLNVTIPEPEALSPPLPTPTATSPNTKAGFFTSLRHSPSKHSVSSASRQGLSMTPIDPVPPLPPLSVAASQMTSEPSEASTSAPLNAPLNKVKEKSSGWFAKRSRSARAEMKRPATAHGNESRTRERRASLGFTTSVGSATSVSDMSHRTAPPFDPQLSESIPGPSQPLAHPFAVSSRPSMPDIPASPSSPETIKPGPNRAQHSPTSRKSQPDLGSKASSAPSKLPSPRSMKRPATAGATDSPTRESFGRIGHSPYVPPLPAAHHSSQPLSAARPRPPPSSFDPSVPKEERDQRRASVNVASSTPVKRASRKLSFTSGMFSFVRRDKDKDKDKQQNVNGHLNGLARAELSLNSGPLSPSIGAHPVPGVRY